MKKVSWFALVLALLAFGAQPAAAQGAEGFRIGPHVAWGDDFDIAVGGTATIGLGSILEGRARGYGAFDYFLDCDPGFDLEDDFSCSYWELTVGGLFALLSNESGELSVGAGLNYARYSIDEDFPGFDLGASSSDTGLAALGAYRFNLGSLAAMANARITLGGAEQLVLALAILFGS